MTYQGQVLFRLGFRPIRVGFWSHLLPTKEFGLAYALLTADLADLIGVTVFHIVGDAHGLDPGYNSGS
jgi:hypothetical protein